MSEYKNEAVGKNMREMSSEELSSLYGANSGTVQPCSTVLCSASFSFIGSYLVTEIWCKE